MKKRIYFILIVASIITVTDIIWRFIACFAYSQLPDNMYPDYSFQTYTGRDDIIVLGASRAQHHYNSSIIEDSLGMSCFNMGCDGYGIAQQYCSFIKTITSSKPKLVILDLSPYQVKNAMGGRGDDPSIFIPFYWNNQYVRKIMDDQFGKIHNLRYISSFVQFNGKHFTILKILMNKDKVYKKENKGYLPLSYSGIENTDLGPRDSIGYIPDTRCVDMLDLIVKTSKDNDIKLYIVISPVTENWNGFSNWLKSYTAEKDVCFLDYSDNKYINSDQRLFNDRHHMNSKGADMFTSKLCSDIKMLMK